MKFRVEHESLADALTWVARALPTRPVVPVLSGLRLTAAAELSLSCFDYELAAAAQLPADVSEPGTALVPGKLLADITRSLPAEPAEVRTEADEVILTCGSAEFSLVSLPLAEYPELPEPPPLAGTIDGGELAGAIGQVMPAVSRDDTLPILTAVCLDIHGDLLTLAATDRYRLAVRHLRWQPTDPGVRAIALVPGRTLADAARVMAPGVPVSLAFAASGASADATPARTGDGPAAASGAPPGRPSGPPAGRASGAVAGRASEPPPVAGMIAFGSSGRRLTGRLLGGEYIRYETRFPAEFGCRAEVPAASFTEALRRASLVADRATPVRLTFGEGRVVIESQAEGRARAVEKVTASFHGEEPVIAFQPHYLLDGVTAAVGGQAPAADVAIRLEFTSPAKPALITLAGAAEGGGTPARAGQGDDGRGAPAFRYLVVPLRTPVRA
jgi:DNA polymerase III subunit beta